MNTGRTHFKKGVAPWNKGVMVSKVCLTCGKKYDVHPYRAEKTKSCSRECRKRPRQCVLCSGVFYAHGKKLQKFCSLGCQFKNKKGKMPKNFGKEFKIDGKDNYNWKGGITPINRAIRTSKKYIDWRISVFKRDNYTCLWCGDRGVTLHADHIKPFALYPELHFELSNGRTLCVPCHRQTDTYAGRGIKRIKTQNGHN